MRLKCYFALLFFAVIVATQSAEEGQAGRGGEEFIDQQALEDKEAKILREDFERDLHSWVQDELASASRNAQFQQSESFLLQLAPQQQHQFRWTSQAQQTDLQLKIRVFTQESGDDIVIIKNPAQDSRVEASYKNSFSEEYQPLVNVYLEKVVKVSMRGEGIYIMLRNTHDVGVIIQVSLEYEPARINAALISTNDDFKVAAVKMEAILAEMKVTESNRKRHYKWEWGFLQREEHYQQQMLKLTAAETVIIFGTSIVQMYCIKMLLDHNNII